MRPAKSTFSMKAIIALILLSLMIATGCAAGAPAEEAASSEPASDETRTESAAESGPTVWENEEATDNAEASVIETVEVEKVVENEVEAEAVVEEASSASPEESGAVWDDAGTDDDRPGETPPETEKVERTQFDPLKAGVVDDNVKWHDYLDYRRNYQGPWVHDRDVSERYIVNVVDRQGYPVMDAHVRFYANAQGDEIYQAYTYANGQVIFHPRTLNQELADVDDFLAVINKDNAVAKLTIPRDYANQNNGESTIWTATLDMGQHFESAQLDILFLLDATGSMADEIGALQSTIFDVADRIDQLPGQQDVRFGLVAYRDRGDAYISKTFDFANSVGAFSESLGTISANGGGDYPESLNEGLHNALHNVQWRGEGTIRLIFLVADAPPHLDYHQDFDYAEDMEIAARSAVKIFPVASSGLDEQGEYIFRQLAQFTQGRFIFLTYDGPNNGGSPGDVTTHNVDSYSVDTLDDLLVNMVTAELAQQNPELAQQQ